MLLEAVSGHRMRDRERGLCKDLNIGFPKQVGHVHKEPIIEITVIIVHHFEDIFA